MAESARVLEEEAEGPPSVDERQAPAWAAATHVPAGVPQQRGRPLEVALLIAFSAVLHGGVAYGFYGGEQGPHTRVSKVDIEFVAPPEEAAPPPPPPPPPPEAAKPPEPQAPVNPVAPPPEPQPEAAPPPSDATEVVDTGSSAEAADDGNLVAGKGGTGIPQAPPAPPAPVVAPPPAPVIQAHEGANYSKNPRPGYPQRALRERWQGRVLLRVQVQPNGRAGIIKVQTSSGHTQLDEAAQEAVKGWSFVPARQGGEPVAGWVTVPIEFRLK